MLGLRLVLLALVVAAACARAGADEPEAARQQAKVLRDQGASAAQAHDFVVALDCFERAYAVYPSANLLFNIGVALDRLQRSDRAVAAFEEFLAGAADAPASARDFARERLRALEPKVARLTLTVEPRTAAVQLDGAPLYAPLSRPIPIAPGEHTLVATLAGHRPARARLELSAGAAEQRSLRLEPEPPLAPIATAPPPPPPVVSAPAPAHAMVATPPVSTRRLRAAGIGVVSFGVAALAVAVGLTVNTARLSDAANHPAPGSVFDPDILDRGRTSQALETGFYAVGGAAAVTGVTLLVVAARRNHHAR